MAGLEADVSSYNQPLPVSPMETVKNLAGIQQQKLQIDQVKMDQANQALGYMTRAMGSLGPNATKEEYASVAENAVKQGLVPQAQLNTYMERLQKAPTAGAFFNEFITAAKDHQQQIDYHLGVASNNSNGQTVTPTVRSVRPGFGERPIGMPVQQQIPPGTPVINDQNQPALQGPTPAQAAQGAATGPTPLPASRPAGLPVERPTTGPTGPTVRTDEGRPATFSERTAAAYPKSSGPATGPTPLFAEGKEAYTKAQIGAGAKAQAIKPAIQAVKLMQTTYGPDGKLLATGPGTGQFNDLVALGKAWGVVDTKAENDPTVMRQEVEKKLAQYVGNSPIGQRSDAAQTLAEAGSPNPKKQILPALLNLTRDAIALDRVQILKPQAFKGQKFDDYVKHEGNFPQSIDEKALTLDLMDSKERDKLTNKMKSDYKNGDGAAKKKAVKFFETLQLARDAKLYDGD